MQIPLEQVGFAIIGTLFLLGIVGVVLNKFGLISFGKTTPCDNCQERIIAGAKQSQQILQTKVDRIETDITSIKTDNGAIWQKLDKISDDVSYIRGWVSRNGTNTHKN